MTRHFDTTSLARATSLAEPIISDYPQSNPRRWSGLRIGLVNNMPDGALVATEQQFASLVRNATAGRVNLELFYFPSLPRSEAAAHILAQHYRPVSELYRNGIDALIVTGNEPRAPRLDQESYWNDMTKLVDWAADNTRTTFWSCLAAHAAVLHLDQVERRRLPAKRSGVYQCATSFDRGLNTKPFLMCHSRLNDVGEVELLDAGYRILSRNGTGEVDVFIKEMPSCFLFLQGHPEYDALSLAREYRRDVDRYLNGSRNEYPAMPENYFHASVAQAFGEFRKKAEVQRHAELIMSFPEPVLRTGLVRDLADSAAEIFAFWMDQVLENQSKKAVAI